MCKLTLRAGSSQTHTAAKQDSTQAVPTSVLGLTRAEVECQGFVLFKTKVWSKAPGVWQYPRDLHDMSHGVILG